MEQTQKQKNGFMMKLATFIVDKRNLFLLITIILLAFLAFSRNWVEVENDQTAYLPASCETEQALNVMSDQFTTYGTAEVMVANITYDEAEALSGRIGAVKGVQSVAFDETSGHYARASALFTVTFDRDETDDACLTSLDAVKELLADYEKEAALLTELESRGEIDHAVGLANTEAMDGCMLADKLTPRQFSELAGLDYEMAQVVYAAEQGDYGKLMGNIASYKVPLIDMFLFVCEQADAGIIQLDAEQMSMLSAAQTQMRSAKAQLQGSDYSRMLLYLTLPVSGDETCAFIDTVRTLAQSYYPDGNVYVAGDSTNEYDFQKSFARDNTVVSIVSILIVLVVLFMFLSAGMPVLLILVIQGGIWINFSLPALLNQPLFFMSYLVVSSIQMGANIDYAIVIASRYQELKNTMSHRDAMIETLNFAFPTVITSGTILAVAGTLIGQMTSEAAIVGIGQSLGRGTIISILFVLFVLPQILLLGGGLADKTSISMPTAARTHQSRERVFVVGLVPGEISGTVSGRGGRNRLHRLSASAAGLRQALRRGYLFKGLTVVLTDDIDADGAAVSIPIFLGDFDGQGHKITGLCLTESCSEYGLFSRVESGASVRNLTVEGEVIPAGTQTDVGGIVGQMVPDITLRFSSSGLDEL